MRRVIWAAALTFALTAAAVEADQQASGQPQKAEQPDMTHPTAPSAEVRALAPLFTRNLVWTSTVPAGAMGPGSKEMTAKGQANCRAIAGGFAYSCLIQLAVGQGKEAMKYTGELVVGYDASVRAYRGFSVFNDGSAMPMDGKLEGKKFTLESSIDIMEMGKPGRERMVFDFTDPNNIKYTEAHKVGGGDWQVLSESIMKPTGKATRAPANP